MSFIRLRNFPLSPNACEFLPWIVLNLVRLFSYIVRCSNVFLTYSFNVVNYINCLWKLNQPWIPGAIFSLCSNLTTFSSFSLVYGEINLCSSALHWRKPRAAHWWISPLSCTLKRPPSVCDFQRKGVGGWATSRWMDAMARAPQDSNLSCQVVCAH